MKMPEIRIEVGDVLGVLGKLCDGTVNCVVTSPPYWGLRDYGVAGQIGLEATPEEYVEKMVRVFREVRRVLRDDGTCWVNLGDSYAGGGRGGNPEDSDFRKQATNAGSLIKPSPIPCGLKAKDLVGIPWRVAFALQSPHEMHLIPDRADRAWLAAMIDGEGCITIPECRSGHDSGSSFPPIIQIRMCDTQCLEKCVLLTGKGGNLNKQLPPSCAECNQRAAYQWRINGKTVAETLADVYPFLLIKRKQACVAWTLQKIRDSYETKRGMPIPDVAREKQKECRKLISRLNQQEAVDLPSWIEEPRFIVEPGWYLRQDCIWHKPNPMPESVTDRCTKTHEYIFMLSKSERYWYDNEAVKEIAVTHVCNGGGRVFGGKNKFSGVPDDHRRGGVWNGHDGSRNRRSVWTIPTQPYSEAHFATFPEELPKLCILAGCPVGGTVLDPFGGSGTTGKVALELGRSAILIELNPKYAELAKARTNVTAGFSF